MDGRPYMVHTIRKTLTFRVLKQTSILQIRSESEEVERVRKKKENKRVHTSQRGREIFDQGWRIKLKEVVPQTKYYRFNHKCGFLFPQTTNNTSIY